MKEYLNNLYGNCSEVNCKCLKPGNHWLGTLCPNWIPLPISSWEEYYEYLKKENNK